MDAILNYLKESQCRVEELKSEGKTATEIYSYFDTAEWDDFCNAHLERFLSESIDNLSAYYSERKDEQSSYTERLCSIWGDGFAWMRRFYAVCQYICEQHQVFIQARTALDKPNAFEALMKIQKRAMQVYAEIICLLENGFPGGACMHTRTLYELWIIAELLFNDTDAVSGAFLASEGSKDDEHYDWAKTSEKFKDKEHVTFGQIRRRVEKDFEDTRSSMSKRKVKRNWDHLYTLQSQLIHPCAEGIQGNVFYLNGEPVPMERSLHGLRDPAINASIFVFNMSELLLSLNPSKITRIGCDILDVMIGQKINPVFEGVEAMQSFEREIDS